MTQTTREEDLVRLALERFHAQNIHDHEKHCHADEAIEAFKKLTELYRLTKENELFLQNQGIMLRRLIDEMDTKNIS